MDSGSTCYCLECEHLANATVSPTCNILGKLVEHLVDATATGGRKLGPWGVSLKGASIPSSFSLLPGCPKMISSLPPPWLVLPRVPNKTRDHEWNSWIQLFLQVSQRAQVFCHCGGMLTDGTLLVLGYDGIPYNCVTAVSSPRRKWPFCPSLVNGGS